jgi:preprotein translocase subunit SecD
MERNVLIKMFIIALFYFIIGFDINAQENTSRITFRIENSKETESFLEGKDILEIKILEDKFMDNIFVSFTLNDNGRKKLFEMTKGNIGNNICIFLDSTLIMSAKILMPLDINEIAIQGALDEKMIFFINTLIAQNIINWDWALWDNN